MWRIGAIFVHEFAEISQPAGLPAVASPGELAFDAVERYAAARCVTPSLYGFS
jgi:hypothetical protein